MNANFSFGEYRPPLGSRRSAILFAQPAIDSLRLASLDMNPVHTNEEWAARAKVFGIP